MKTKRIKHRLNSVGCRICAVVVSLRENGVTETGRKVLNYLRIGRRLSYRRWAKTPLYTEEELQKQRQRTFGSAVKFSIITPLYNTDAAYLREMIDSVLAQTYADWELCMADGSDGEHGYVEGICADYAEKEPRIRYRKLDHNLGIAGNSNACIDMATGDYIAILDHDDILHPAALHDVMERICAEEADFIYTDELTFVGSDPRRIKLINFKKDYAPDDLRANNYICHFTAFRRDLLDSCGAFRDEFEGSQDHDLFLRLTAAAERICHIAKPLYYWRAYEGSTAYSTEEKPYAGENGRKAVRASLAAAGIRASVESTKGAPTIYRVSYEIPSPEPSVSIIIPSCDHVSDLGSCIASILQKTTYRNYEIIIVENNSRDPETFRYYKEIGERSGNITVAIWKGQGFNWSALNNYAAREVSTGEFLLFLNNDTEVITPDWIQELLMHAQRPEVGVAGAMLYYPDDTIQHAGAIMGLKSVAGHVFHGNKRGAVGYLGRLCYAQNLSAVTGACQMVRRSVYEEVGGYDEMLAVCWNDIDFCLRIREAGYLVVWTPYAELYHYEGKSRGRLDEMRHKARAAQEADLMRARWAGILEEGDPYYNPNLSLESYDFRLKKR